MKKLYVLLSLILFTSLLISCSVKSKDVLSNIDKEQIDMNLEKSNLSADTIENTTSNSQESPELTNENNLTEVNEALSTTTIIGDTTITSNQVALHPIRDISSMDLVKEISIGWNLGNTMEATGKGLTSEIAWGNPFTTKEMIDKVKEAGFNTIRIPVTWENHLTSSLSNTIHPEWLERVKEVVDYAIEDDMFVILNLHHEDWHYPSYENLGDAKEILISLWTQIGNYFEDYDEHLIFEGMNEPRLKGSTYEWTTGTIESRDVINQLNLTFIYIIRNLSGNNPKRHVMIPPYAASSNEDAWVDYVVPKDDKVIVSIHGYLPYDFALNKEGTNEFNPTLKRQTRDIDSFMENIDTKFLQNNIPVIIGEFGALDKDNLNDRVVWSTYYVQQAKEKGIPCIWWDNGSFLGTGENFGLFDRRNNTFVFPEIIDALMEGIHSSTITDKQQ